MFSKSVGEKQKGREEAMEEKGENTSYPSVERRQFPRLVASANVEYTLVKEKLLPENKSILKNISSGGICLIVYEKVAIGSHLSLKIYLSDINREITATGKVIWSSPFSISSDNRQRYDLGIEFVEIDESDRQQLSQHIFRLIQ